MEDMFVLAPIGGALPPVGTRITYDVVQDAKTGRPRGENMQLESAGMAAPYGGKGKSKGKTVANSFAPPPQQFHYPAAPMMSGGQCAGTILKDNGKFGFIQQDSGQEDMFVLAPPGGSLPPLGTRVVYDVVTDAKTGRPRAENLQHEGAAMPGKGGPLMSSWPGAAGQRSGTMVKGNGKFGFIQQDCGEQDMFMLPAEDGSFPAPGTRVTYDVVSDAKTGRPRAENVHVDGGSSGYGSAPKGKGKGKGKSYDVRSQPYGW